MEIRSSHFPALMFFLGMSMVPQDTFGADQKRTRDEQVHDDRKELESRDDWLYNDLEAGFAAAQQSKKPLMIVFRCIP